MKHRLFLIIATLVGLGSITTSCSWDDELVVANNDGDQKTPISFNVNIGSLPDPEVTTRSNDPLGANASKATRGYSTSQEKSGYTFSGGEYIAIAIKGKSGSSRSTTTEEIKQYTITAGSSGGNDLTYQKDKDGSTETNAFDWLSQNEHVYIRAWSDGKTTTPSNITSNTAPAELFEIESSQSADVKELLYSPSTEYSYGDIDIKLYHQLSRIVVNVTSSITDGVTISGVTIGKATDDHNHLVPIKGTFAEPTTSAKYGNWTVATYASQSTHWGTITAKEETTPTVISEGPPIVSYQKTYTAVIIPGTASEVYKEGLKLINISISGGGTYSYAIPTGGITFEPGKQYTFNITDLNQIDFNVTVSAWDSGGSEPAANDLPFSE